MRKLAGFEKAKVITGERTQLPKGGYVVKIMDCREVKGEKNGNEYSYLAFSFDIVEGDHKGHFENVYNASNDENKKWKGVHNLFIPQEGSTYYEDSMSRFKTTTVNFEESNEGYHWDWDEKKLKGKLIGIVYGEKEFETSDGDIIIITEPKYFTSVNKIRENKYKVPALKELKRSVAASQTYSFSDFEPSNEKLPWEI